MSILTVNNIEKYYSDKKVLDNINFKVQKGEIMAILGPNGAGKSTTIRTIMGIMYPDEGTILFEGKAQIPRSRIGYLPEERGLYKNVKVMDILLYLADIKDYPLKKAKERALSYLKKFDLEGKENVSVDELSKGMSQKVQFIASVIHEPELLILDEPFSGLDPVSQELFKEEIKRLAEQGTAILISSHQMNLVEEICDRLFMIHQGKQIIYGHMSDVKKKYANFKCVIHGENKKSVFTNIDGIERLKQERGKTTLYLDKDIIVATWLRQLPMEIDIQEMTIDRTTLHEIFIDIATENHDKYTEEGAMYA